jgi:hypothetical protein
MALNLRLHDEPAPVLCDDCHGAIHDEHPSQLTPDDGVAADHEPLFVCADCRELRDEEPETDLEACARCFAEHGYSNESAKRLAEGLKKSAQQFVRDQRADPDDLAELRREMRSGR